jgi:sulfoquinovosyltransferase
MKEEFISHGFKKVEIWQKGVDVDKFNPSYKSLAMRNELSDGNPTSPLLIYVGRLGEEKRIDDLKHVLDLLPEVRLALVGKVKPKSKMFPFLSPSNNTNICGISLYCPFFLLSVLGGVVVSKGPAEPHLRKTFTRNTKFVGLLEGERLSQAFASADIFVMPSDTETLGKVYSLLSPILYPIHLYTYKLKEAACIRHSLFLLAPDTYYVPPQALL